MLRGSAPLQALVSPWRRVEHVACFPPVERAHGVVGQGATDAHGDTCVEPKGEETDRGEPVGSNTSGEVSTGCELVTDMPVALHHVLVCAERVDVPGVAEGRPTGEGRRRRRACRREVKRARVRCLTFVGESPRSAVGKRGSSTARIAEGHVEVSLRELPIG